MRAALERVAPCAMFPKFELIAIMMNFMILPKARRPSVIPRSSTPNRLRKKSVGGASSPIRRLLPLRNPLI
jgi:hypothetical protein